MKPTHVFLAFGVRIAVALMVTAIVVSIVRAAPPAFTVTNRMAEFKVVNKCPAPTKKVKAFSTRPPRGHTHTCAHGHTWDHDANPTHTCQFCGMTQYVVDTPSRPVTIVTTKTIKVESAPTVKETLPVRVRNVTAYEAPPVLQSLYSSVSSGGCANGQCATAQSGRGLFRRW